MWRKHLGELKPSNLQSTIETWEPATVTIKTEIWKDEVMDEELPKVNFTATMEVVEEHIFENEIAFQNDTAFQDDNDEDDWPLPSVEENKETKTPKRAKRKRKLNNPEIDVVQRKKDANKKFKCFCGTGFSCRNRLQQHITAIHREIPIEDWIPCHVCGKKFKIKAYVENHVKNKHRDSKGEPKKIPCSVCGKFLCKNALISHERRHLMQKDATTAKLNEVQCDLCGQKKSEKAYLLSHIERVHLKLKKQVEIQLNIFMVH